ncbi:MAG: HlyD family efflux transporter periplasmic adaptor subunit [bacterium]|nr:HlyD family efflux transporter periplasmic adaptor subunit [bacterium]
MSEEQEAIKKSEEAKAIRRAHIEAQLDSIELRSEAVQEIMGYIPHWLIRWGITVFCIIIFIFLLGSWFFQYPDIIMSTITVTTENPPAAIIARTSGKIEQLFVQDKQAINSGKIIGIIESAADYKHVFEINEKLAGLQAFSPHYDTTGAIQFDTTYAMGPLQTTYSVFLKSYSDYRYFIRLDYHNKKIESLQTQLEKHQVLVQGQIRQNSIMEQEFQLRKQQYDRSASLLKDGVISQNDFDSAKTSYLQREFALEGARSTLTNQRITQSQLEQSVLDLRLKFREQEKQMQLSLNQAYDNLTGQIKQWEQDYLLKSPVTGTVAFNEYWSINQNVKAGDRVFTVIPDKAGEIIGKVVLPMRGSGKVKIHQEVNIKFMNFPYMDYGMVRGVIKSKSLVASDNNYALEVTLPDGLKTNYGKDLPFSQEMAGTAEIITEDIRLLERVFKPIKNILKKM